MRSETQGKIECNGFLFGFWGFNNLTSLLFVLFSLFCFSASFSSVHVHNFDLKCNNGGERVGDSDLNWIVEEEEMNQTQKMKIESIRVIRWLVYVVAAVEVEGWERQWRRRKEKLWRNKKCDMCHLNLLKRLLSGQYAIWVGTSASSTYSELIKRLTSRTPKGWFFLFSIYNVSHFQKVA